MYQDYSGNYDTSSRGSSTSPAQPESFTSGSSTIGSPISTSSYQVRQGANKLEMSIFMISNMKVSVQSCAKPNFKMLFSSYCYFQPLIAFKRDFLWVAWRENPNEPDDMDRNSESTDAGLDPCISAD